MCIRDRLTLIVSSVSLYSWHEQSSQIRYSLDEYFPVSYTHLDVYKRQVQRMFDTAISFRLAQLKDAWRALHSAEVRLKRPLPEIRALLTRVPVDPASSEDEAWLAQFDNKSFAEQQMMEWQLWFLNNQRQAITKLEELK